MKEELCQAGKFKSMLKNWGKFQKRTPCLIVIAIQLNPTYHNKTYHNKTYKNTSHYYYCMLTQVMIKIYKNENRFSTQIKLWAMITLGRMWWWKYRISEPWHKLSKTKYTIRTVSQHLSSYKKTVETFQILN